MHPLRKKILSELILSLGLPFSKLKPKDTESNIFMYHLKQLIADGLVLKDPEGKYALTFEGKIFADYLSFKSFHPRLQPKIVTMIVCKNRKGELLLYKKKRQPFLGMITFPFGKIHLGESVLAAASREILEKTGIKGRLEREGIVYMTILQGDKILSSMLCHVFAGTSSRSRTLQTTETGECFWADILSVEADLMPGMMDVYKLIQTDSRKLFFQEFTYNL